MHQAPCILEGFVPFERGGLGRRRAHARPANSRPTTSAPTPTATTSSTSRACRPASRPAAEREALAVARRIADALDYVGVLAVEMFLVEGRDGERVVVNEIAPRVHNSGHWTIEGAVTSQFEQHVRPICGWPLGSAAAPGRVEMGNLIGDDVDGWDAILRPSPARICTSTARPRPARAARWATSRGSGPCVREPR